MRSSGYSFTLPTSCDIVLNVSDIAGSWSIDMNNSYDTAEIARRVQRLRDAGTLAEEVTDRFDRLGRAAHWERLLRRSFETPAIGQWQEASVPAAATSIAMRPSIRAGASR
jgi:hypothetical protein